MIGILGGAFNPVHVGHLEIAEAARVAHNLEKVIFIPTFRPPHKSEVELLDPQHRLNMVRLALADHEGFECSDIEIRRRGISYTIETLKALLVNNPGIEYALIVGGDSLSELHTWKEIEQILKLCRVIAVNRPGFTRSLDDLEELLKDKKLLEKILHITSVRVDVSSSQIRSLRQKGQAIAGLVNESVAQYIDEQQLYLEGKCT